MDKVIIQISAVSHPCLSSDVGLWLFIPLRLIFNHPFYFRDAEDIVLLSSKIIPKKNART